MRNAYGAELESKASDAFCVAIAPRAERRGGLEAVGFPAAPTPPAPSTVVEFVESAVPAEVRDVRREASEALLEALGGPGAEGQPPEVTRQVGPASRQLVVTSFRDRFLADADRITDELERAASVLYRGPLEAAGPTDRPAFTDVCWLNRSIRARSDPATVGDVAADPTIERIDVPRRLEPELRQTTSVVGANDFRAATGTGGEGVIVAVIDSEVAGQHPGLAGRVVHKQNYTLEAFGNPDRHGTAVAGIVGSSGEVEGIAPQVTIYNYKVLATTSLLNGDDFDGALAIQQALEDGAHVANCSWGAGPAGTGTSREARACDTAWAFGLTLVKSAGNRGPGNRTLTTPADAEGVIVVGATNRAGTSIESYSSRGPTGSGVSRPHLVAPGGSPDDGVVSCLPHGGYGGAHGTSFAAPHVAGLAALLLDENPTLDPDALRDALLDAASPLADLAPDDQGRGLVRLSAPASSTEREPGPGPGDGLLDV